ncbi:MAG: DUF4190 domain-containing protein [Thermoleophilia bacterium]
MLNRLAANPLLSSGLGLGVLANILALFAPGKLLATGPAYRDSLITVGLKVPMGAIAAFILFAVLLGVAMGLPMMWAKLSGIGVLAASSATFPLLVVIGRQNRVFADKADLTLKSGATVLIVAMVVSTGGLVLALIGARLLADPPRVPIDDQGNALTGPTTSGHAITSMVLGIASIIFGPVPAALAVAFASVGMTQIGLSNGHRTGRGMAIAGLVLGIVVLSILALVGLLACFLASPQPK